MNGEVCFYKDGSDDYDPVTGIGGEGIPEIIWQGKARIQQLRAPREFVVPYSAGSTRYFRFQIDPDDKPPFFPQGTKARVLFGGRDPDLELLAYTVNSAINSSHMAVRTVELAANMDAVKWDWTPIPSNGLFPSLMLYPSTTIFPIGA